MEELILITNIYCHWTVRMISVTEDAVSKQTCIAVWIGWTYSSTWDVMQFLNLNKNIKIVNVWNGFNTQHKHWTK